MAKEFEDGGLWLPSDFLCDEFVLSGGGGKDGGGDFATACFPGEFPFGLGSNLDSPVESVIETEESDEEEEHIAGLAQQMARYFLQDEDKLASGGAADDAKAMARSPQSTLCAWSAASNKGSPNGPSLVSSPPSTSPMKEQNKDLGDLLYEAAGHVIRFRSNDLGSRESLYDRGILGAPKKPTVLSSVASENASFSYHATCAVTPVLTHQQLQAAQFHHLRQQQTIKHPLSVACGRQSKARGGGRPLDLSPSAWPPLRKPPPQQQQHPQPPLPGSGMRAVFLHNAGSRKESAGTGVFLPRTVGKKVEPRTRTGCSTVLVPDRVVQALNLNLEEFAAQPRFPGGFVLSHDALVGRSSAGLSHQRRKHNLTASPTPDAAVATAATHDIGLPQEWTY
ncbi:hypothetical protein OPV22_017254 [Ensete ventricosum]|uniref:Uncharacterized protein n=1 Tax=Ensete ventricosum TaxID=4639 RepID=A0AAV8R1M3_ENSVE|nr:hypothetical protein OPV22_017254 [Ensete ventricosum]